MKINLKELAEASYGDSTLEGRLHYKKISNKSQSGFKERWFKLRLNMLFYFNLSETGTVVENKPSGCYILEQCSASLYVTQAEAETPFSFLLKFHDEEIVFSGRSDEQVRHWVTAMNASSYGILRSRLRQLKMELSFLKGEEPYLPFPVSQVSDVNMNDELSHKEGRKKKPKQQSFRCYLPTNLSAASAASERLEIVENHFSNNIGIDATTCSKENESSILSVCTIVPHRENSPASSSIAISSASTEDSSQNLTASSAAIPRPRPRPIRKAPNPPTVPMRPPRGQKTNHVQIVNSGNNIICDNLIDL